MRWFPAIVVTVMSCAAVTGCTDYKNCVPHETTFCDEGTAYWVDSCGDVEEAIEVCDCGCKSDHSACEDCSCEPDCTGRVCGPDPECGRSCGDCDAGETCTTDGQCTTCAPACGQRECGPDPKCGVSCGTCETGQTCTLQGQCSGCEPECGARECGPDPECGVSCGDCIGCEGQPDPELCMDGGFCAQVCCPDCTGRECGDDGCAGICGVCDTGQVCGPDGQCAGDPCCAGVPLHADIAGAVVEFPPATYPVPLSLQLAAVSVMEALTNPDPMYLDEVMSGPSGTYQTDCINLENVALGVLMLTDDPGFDGSGGVFFPAYTGVMEINSNQDKTCVDPAPPVYGVQNTLVEALSQVPALYDIVDEGFLVIIILDSGLHPVQRSVLRKEDGSDLHGVVYPSVDFTSFDGESSSASGIAIVPGPLALTSIIAVSEGHFWEAVAAAAVPGHCFVRLLIADP